MVQAATVKPETTIKPAVCERPRPPKIFCEAEEDSDEIVDDDFETPYLMNQPNVEIINEDSVNR